jgi:aminoglycoside phosphotransferase
MQGGAEVPFDIMIVRIRDRRARVVAHGDYCCPSWNR